MSFGISLGRALRQGTQVIAHYWSVSGVRNMHTELLGAGAQHSHFPQGQTGSTSVWDGTHVLRSTPAIGRSSCPTSTFIYSS